jgi:glycosyltransferase involved in cell wall biosynthesis
VKLLVTHEIHAREVNGRFYNHERGVIDYNALCNYRYLIKDIVLVVRGKKADSVGEGWLRIDGEGISVAPIREPDSFIDIIILLPEIVAAISRAVKLCDRYIVRLPGPTGTIVAIVLIALRKKYGVEFVGQASETFILTRKALRLRRLYGWIIHFATRLLVWLAYCVAYRSEYLRELYPNKSAKHEWVFSGAQLDEKVITGPRSVESFQTKVFNIIFVGRLHAEKGLINLLHACKILSERADKPVELHLVGDGVEYQRLKEETDNLGIGHIVRFHGRIPRGPKLFSLLDQAHLFVLPSLSEGMPRSLIEAMARGLPAIGSSVGGIPELLDKDYLFPPNNPDAIAEKILSLIGNPEKLAAMSLRNFTASKAHWNEGLESAKSGFWNEVATCCK